MSGNKAPAKKKASPKAQAKKAAKPAMKPEPSNNVKLAGFLDMTGRSLDN
jgi:hypothetical protein